jgi:hypothetical protein
MPTRTRKTLLVGAITVLEAGCILGVACLGRTIMPAEPISPVRDIVARPEVATLPPDLEVSTLPTQRAPGGAALADDSDPGRDPVVSRSDRTPRKESEFHAVFLRIAASGTEALEQAVRSALAADGPDCQKVAALRALCDARCPTTEDLLVAAIEDLPDVSGPRSESVPRFALRLLVERASCDAGARRALERVAWDAPMPVRSALRTAAAMALAATATEDEIWRVASQLRSETDPLVVAGAVEALSGNPRRAAADAALRSLGFEFGTREEAPERHE